MSRGASFQTPRSVRSRAMFSWLGTDGEDFARTQQPMVFTRDGNAWAWGPDGRLYRAPKNHPRFSSHLPSGAYGLLLEPRSDTNSCTQPANFASWTAVNAPSRVANALDLGVLKLDYLVDDSATLQEHYSLVQNVAASVHIVSLFVSRGATAQTGLVTFADSGATTRLSAQIVWSGEVPSLTMTTGTAIVVEEVPGARSPLGYRVYRLAMLTTTPAGGNGTLTVRPVNTASSQGQMYAGGVQVANAPSNHHASYIHANTTKAQEQLYWGINFDPQPLTVYLSCIDLGASRPGAAGTGVLLGLGHDGSGVQPNRSLNLTAYNNTRFDMVYKDNGAVTYGPILTTTPPTYGQRLELRAVLRSGGGAGVSGIVPLTLGSSVAGAAEVTADGGAPVALDTTWASNRLYVCPGSNSGMLLEALRVYPGEMTMTQCREWL